MTKNRLILIFLLIGQYCFGQESIKQLPLLKSIYNIDDSTKVFADVLPKSGQIMLVFYDPGCGHCQELTQGIAANLREFGNTSIFFICMQDKVHIKGFINMFGKSMIGKSNISFWRDPGTEFFEKFLPENYPAIYFYNAVNHNLIKSFQGEVDLAKMLKF